MLFPRKIVKDNVRVFTSPSSGGPPPYSESDKSLSSDELLPPGIEKPPLSVRKRPRTELSRPSNCGRRRFVSRSSSVEPASQIGKLVLDQKWLQSSMMNLDICYLVVDRSPLVFYAIRGAPDERTEVLGCQMHPY